MRIEIHELATREFDDAMDWHELQSKGLDKRFKKSVIDKIRKIRQNPGWFPKETDSIFKAYVPKFPYKILYTLHEDKIVIWSIAHMHRKPWYWQSRMI